MEAQLKEAKFIAEDADRKYDEVNFLAVVRQSVRAVLLCCFEITVSAWVGCLHGTKQQTPPVHSLGHE